MELENGKRELRSVGRDRVTPIRRCLRLPGYDYSQAGAYFVTLCAHHRECFFGEVLDGRMRMNAAGEMVARWLSEVQYKFPNAKIDAHIVMPNHVHAIVVLRGAVGADLRVRPPEETVTNADGDTTGAHKGAPLPRIVQWIKTMATNGYMHGVESQGWPPFPGRLWQRSYYDHIIRDENDLRRAREYIEMNPARWAEDEEYTGVPCV